MSTHAEWVLLVGAETQALEELAERLEKSGIGVQRAADSATTWHLLFGAEPGAVVIDLDVSSPELHPWELCEELAARSRVLIAGLLREASLEQRMRALSIGAQQVFGLPEGGAELLAFLHAQLPRLRKGVAVFRSGAAAEVPSLIIDRENQRVLRGEHSIYLSPREFALVALLAERSGCAVSHKELCRKIWKSRSLIASRGLLKLYVARLRRKIELDPHRPLYLRNVRGVGYALHCELPPPHT